MLCISLFLLFHQGACLALGTYDQLTEAGVDLGSLMEDYEQERRHRLASMTSTTSSISIVDEISDGTTPLPMYESTQSINSSVDGYNEVRIYLFDYI